jgi:hypothetical protein
MSGSVSISGRFFRLVLRKAWNELVRKDSNQQDMIPPGQGGNEIRLNTAEEAMILAEISAQEARLRLQKKMPFSLGVPVASDNIGQIVGKVVDSIKFDHFPTVQSANNEWVATAATMQINHSFDTATKSIKPGLESLRTASIMLLIVSILIPLCLVPVMALNDIKVNPRP